MEARRRASGVSNIEYLVCDIANLPFKSSSFDVILALNILDRSDFDKTFLSLDRCIISGGELVITDPYHPSSDSKSLDSINLRLSLKKKGYQIRKRTQRESFIPWIIRVNERAYLFYFTDFIYAVKLISH
jgi:ubiquinone/menaquinone biosynthesis C-methylase UbiE